MTPLGGTITLTHVIWSTHPPPLPPRMKSQNHDKIELIKLLVLKKIN